VRVECELAQVGAHPTSLLCDLLHDLGYRFGSSGVQVRVALKHRSDGLVSSREPRVGDTRLVSGGIYRSCPDLTPPTLKSTAPLTGPPNWGDPPHVR
jgi:hypothetical protein